ncbi:MAG TPA: hypothetical protein VE131_06385 [Terriglobales bacterium]|jgi:hypothetical protein|nr:hypothetical protein [Terriglobales bacterium]
MEKTAGKTEIAILAIWFGLLCVLVHYIVTTPILRYESEQAVYFKIQDFHYCIVMIRSFWSHEIASIYDPMSQLDVVRSHFGIAMNQAMSIGHSPTILLILLPFSLVTRISFPLANTLWVSAFLTVFSVAVLKMGAHLLQYERNRIPVFIAAYSVFLLSFRAVTVIFLGQTTLLASGLLLFLLLEITLARKEGRSLRRGLVYPILFILSIKLHYLALGLAILLIGGYIHEMLASVAIVAVSVATLIAYSGPDLLMGFLEQLSVFSTTELPAYYDMTYIFHTFITFRNAFAPIIGASLSLKISMIVLALGCVALCWIFVPRYGEWRKGRKHIDGTTPEQGIVTLFALPLLFMPYIGGYEDILMIIPFSTAFLVPNCIQKHGKIIALLPFLFVVLNQRVMFSSDHLWLYWGMKASIFVFLFYLLKESTFGREFSDGR